MGGVKLRLVSNKGRGGYLVDVWAGLVVLPPLVPEAQRVPDSTQDHSGPVVLLCDRAGQDSLKLVLLQDRLKLVCRVSPASGQLKVSLKS